MGVLAGAGGIQLPQIRGNNIFRVKQKYSGSSREKNETNILDTWLYVCIYIIMGSFSIRL